MTKCKCNHTTQCRAFRAPTTPCGAFRELAGVKPEAETELIMDQGERRQVTGRSGEDRRFRWQAKRYLIDRSFPTSALP